MSPISATVTELQEKQTEWPEGCRFFNPETMDAKFLQSLLWEDSSYVDPDTEKKLGVIGIGNEAGNNWQRPIYNPSSTALSQWISANHACKIAYVGTKRKYLYRDTINAIRIPGENWMHLLCSLEILPSALELLHDNNGGFGTYVSHDDSSPEGTPAEGRGSPSSFHISMKLGDSWPNHEHFMYARHDFHENANVVLIAGSDSRSLCNRLFGRLLNMEKIDIFTIVAFMLSLWLKQVEQSRWELDYQVQEIESRTGYSSMLYRQYEPMTPEQMSLSKDMAQTADSLALMVTYMENMIKCLEFTIKQHLRYHDLLEANFNPQHSRHLVSELQDTLAQHLSQARSKKLQIQTLQGRVTAQINITNTLIAHRDSRANIELAKAMKEDAVLMKGIALVTMIFLPATFLATFFSMVFFHIGGDGGNFSLEVSRWIWLYPLCTVPLTLVLAYQYGLDTTLRNILEKVKHLWRSTGPKAEGDPEAPSGQKR